MRQLLLTVLLSISALAATDSANADDAQLTVSQERFDNWVRLQESIATEKSDWAVEQEYLNEEILLLTEEIAALEEQKATLNQTTAAIKEELAKLESEETQLKAAADLVATDLPALEAGLRSLNHVFPPSLQDTLDSLTKRLPIPEKASSAGIAERMQVIVGLLSQADKFNGQLSVAPEIRTRQSGDKIQVSVLYLGLAQAWFVSPDGTYAGHGRPGAEGWIWTEDSAIAPLVEKAIAVSENTTVADYVSLPLSFE